MSREAAGRTFLRELLEAAPPEARPRLRRVLIKYTGTTIYLPRARVEARHEAARNMLANGVAPSDALAALVERFGIGRATAGRDLANARRRSKSVDLHSRIPSEFRIERKKPMKIEHSTALSRLRGL